MKARQLGGEGPTVSAIDLGCMSLGLSDNYPSSTPEEPPVAALIHRALDLGVTFLVTVLREKHMMP